MRSNHRPNPASPRPARLVGHFFRPLFGESHDPYPQGSYRSGCHRDRRHHQRSPGQTLCNPAMCFDRIASNGKEERNDRPS